MSSGASTQRATARRLTPTSVAAPAPRRGAAVAGAADRGVVVVHGGLRMQSSGGTAATDELWALHCANGTAWVAPDAVAVGAAAAPGPRAYHSLTAAVGGGDDYGGLAFGDDDDGPPLVLYLFGGLRYAPPLEAAAAPGATGSSCRERCLMTSGSCAGCTTARRRGRSST